MNQKTFNFKVNSTFPLMGRGYCFCFAGLVTEGTISVGNTVYIHTEIEDLRAYVALIQVSKERIETSIVGEEITLVLEKVFSKK